MAWLPRAPLRPGLRSGCVCATSMVVRVSSRVSWSWRGAVVEDPSRRRQQKRTTREATRSCIAREQQGMYVRLLVHAKIQVRCCRMCLFLLSKRISSCSTLKKRNKCKRKQDDSPTSDIRIVVLSGCSSRFWHRQVDVVYIRRTVLLLLLKNRMS